MSTDGCMLSPTLRHWFFFPLCLSAGLKAQVSLAASIPFHCSSSYLHPLLYFVLFISHAHPLPRHLGSDGTTLQLPLHSQDSIFSSGLTLVVRMPAPRILNRIINRRTWEIPARREVTTKSRIVNSPGKCPLFAVIVINGDERSRVLPDWESFLPPFPFRLKRRETRPKKYQRHSPSPASPTPFCCHVASSRYG
ncbi:hypothetical protein J3F84DRAFT_94029 [Trichoderma pleuroticola]